MPAATQTPPGRTPPGGPSGLTDAEFRKVCETLKTGFGIHIEPGKRELVESKISKLLRKKGYPNFQAFADRELIGKRPPGLSDFIDELTTNHTFFWREPAHFEFLQNTVLPEWEDRLGSDRDLRVWCGVSSTGEEPYTIAMTLREHFGARYGAWKAGLLATDIDSKVLTTARAGVYEAKGINGMPQRYKKYFQPAGTGKVKVVPQVANDVLFRRLNLMRRPFPFKKPMHAVFCRNVMIYFDHQTRRELAQAIYRSMAPGGYLFVGHSEPLDRSATDFQVVGPSIYRRPLR